MRASPFAWLVASVLLLLAACGRAGTSANELPFYTTADLTAQWLSQADRAKVPKIAPFSFTDQDGHEVSNATLAGKIYLANFFFTGCPSICPKMTATFLKMQTALADQKDVELVSHTVDPENDTPAQLAAYAQKHGVNSRKWHLLTGPQAAIYALARQSYFAEKRLGLQKGPDEFLHTENMLLVDRKGRIRGMYNATLMADADKALEDVAVLLLERP